jgi:hypothetical protein
MYIAKALGVAPIYRVVKKPEHIQNKKNMCLSYNLIVGFEVLTAV